MTIDIDKINFTDPSFWQRKDRDEAFEAIRNERPAFWNEFLPGPEEASKGFWSVTRYDDIVKVSTDSKTFVSGESTYIGDQTAKEAHEEGWFLNMDAPDHFKLRQIVSKAFSPQGVQKMRDAAERYANELVAAAKAKGGCDFATDVAQPFPVAVVCDFLGAPHEYRKRLHELTMIALAGDAEEIGGVEAIPGAFAELNAIGAALAKERRKAPKDDILSLIGAAEIDGRRLSDEEVGYFFQLLVTAGMETTGTVGAHLMRLLLENPDQMRIWMDDPAGTAPTGIEEAVRLVSPIMHMRRTASVDTEVAGQKIAAGEKVVMWYYSGNRDERQFKDPLKFDVLRNPNPHLGFGGGGRHTCLGAHLARMELPYLVAAALRELRAIEPSAPAKFVPSRFVNGISSLPIIYKAA
ncbi:cytochrome [Rhizobium leguminosarum bv. trifolii]|uniref:Cytochrome n=1 Tax=Rhizobium leguminosarum bv. trifolii TaxID=386 RepID=A0A3E1BIQ8_RHILT|nr:cytochrome P450 [Rhizobium leguminosarum]RFB91362.1 cytochrome [Rhizobium leguminosarum bv. trifolii]RFB92987.1 cytochrome [Rhizobium leguminosarum bv. trifolii]